MCRSAYLNWVKHLEESMPDDALDFSGSAMATPAVELTAILERSSLGKEFQSKVKAEWGHPELFNQLEDAYGMGRKQTVITAGASLALYTVCRTFLNPSSEAIIEWPTYEPFVTTCNSIGARMVEWRRDPETFDFQLETLDELLQTHTQARLVIVSNIHNPSGAFTRSADIHLLADLVDKHKRLLLVDEVFRDLGPAEDDKLPRPAAFERENVISVSGLSKSYGLSALRCGWIFSASRHAEQIRDCHVAIENIGSRLTQLLAAGFMQDIKGRRDANIQQLQNNRNIALAVLQGSQLQPQDYTWLGTVFFPRVGSKATLLVDELAKQKIYVTPGKYFGAPDRIRIGIGGYTGAMEASLRQGLGVVRSTFEGIA